MLSKIKVRESLFQMDNNQKPRKCILVTKPARKQIFVPAPQKMTMSRPLSSSDTPCQALLQSLYDAIIITEAQGNVSECNMRAEDMLGYSKAELAKLNLSQIIPNLNTSLLNTIRQNNQAHRYTLLDGNCRRKNGTCFQAEIAVSGIHWNDVQGICFSIRNITQRKEMEAMLITVNNALYNTANGIVITTTEGIIQFANPAFIDMLNYATKTDVVGKNIRVIFASEPAVMDELFVDVHKLLSCSLEVMLKKRDGSELPAQVVSSPNTNHAGTLTGVVFSFEDITGRLQAEEMSRLSHEKQIETERIQARLDTITDLGYAINSPLQALLVMVELEKRSDYMEQINKIVTILRELHNDPPLPSAVLKDNKLRYKLEAVQTQTPCTPQTILIADDEEALRQLFTRILKHHLPSLKIDVAPDGNQALRKFTETHHSIIILDVVMPEMTGEAAFHEISKFCELNKWEMPHIIFCTGFIPKEGICAIVCEDRYHALLKKPVSVTDLVEAIRAYISADSPLHSPD